MAKISIIIPVYNVESYLRACLDSVQAQTVRDWECVLVDDGSTDKSGEICDEYAARDSRFLVVHKQNEGVGKARITAFEHTEGDYITFIDADDIVLPLYLETLLHPMLEQKADMVSCNFNVVRNSMTRKSRAKNVGTYEGVRLKDFICNQFFYDQKTNDYGMPCFLWTKMVRRDFVLEGLKQGGDLWFAEDQIALFQMLLRIRKLVLLPDYLYNYILHRGQLTRQYNWDLWENIVRALSKFQKLSNGLPIGDGLRKRTWLHIKRTIYIKMLRTDLSKATFIQHISQMRETAYMKEFFAHLTTGFGRKDLKIYWFLKLKLYGIFYNDVVYNVKTHL